MKACVTTVCTADGFQYYLPLFIYAWKRAYPQASLKIFLTGELATDVRAWIENCGFSRLTVHENQFLDVMAACPGKGTPNALRFLVSPKNFAGYDCVYVTDVDLLGFLMSPSHFAWFARRCEHTRSIAAYRSPYRRPRRPSVYGSTGWRGEFHRVAAGTVLLTPRWFAVTRKLRKRYLHLARRGGHDAYDHHQFGSYREYDEVMLGRWMRLAGLTPPPRKYRFPDGSRWPNLYRGVHLGDFKFRRHARLSKMRRLMPKGLVVLFRQMCDEPGWDQAASVACTNDTVREMLRRARKYAGVKE